MSEWKPIETAPKDGTEVLLLLEESSRYYSGCVVSYFDGGEWRDPLHEDDAELSHSGCGKPTHWMPLPTPPA